LCRVKLKLPTDVEVQLVLPPASGAALNVGAWLLESRPIALPPAEIQHALVDHLVFAFDTDTPRSRAFAHVLMQHGADIASASIDDEPALDRAIRYRSKAAVSLLLELGADPAALSVDQTAELHTLLERPYRESTYRRNRPNCVTP